jgi:hypothetical protein
MPVERVVTSEVPLEDGVSSGFEALVDPHSDQIKVVLAVDAAG